MSALEPRRLAAAGALGAALSAVGNVVLFFAASAAGTVSIPDQANPGAFTALPIGPVIGASIVPAVFATGFYAALITFAPARAKAIFVGVSAVFALLSMGGPLGAPDMLSQATLAGMHVVSAVAIAGALAMRGQR